MSSVFLYCLASTHGYHEYSSVLTLPWSSCSILLVLELFRSFSSTLSISRTVYLSFFKVYELIYELMFVSRLACLLQSLSYFAVLPRARSLHHRETRISAHTVHMDTARWKKLRAAVFERDRHSCVACGSTEFLECHHNTYDRSGAEDMDDLVTACRSCHFEHHEKIREKLIWLENNRTIKTSPLDPFA